MKVMPDTMTNIADELRERLKEVVRRTTVEGLLFSGGLDTSVLAVLNPDMKTITVSLETFGEDVLSAELVARNLKLNHYHRRVSIDEAIDSIPAVIKILKSFDPAIPNDLVVYFGLERAREMGIREMMTGDGSDELFGGYSFMKDIDDLGSYIQKISEKMSFSSNELGEFFGIKILQPFVDRNIIDFALQIPVGLKIRKYSPRSCAQGRGNDKVWGKWILRKAFEGLLPAEVIWQDKRPLEYGSGMTKLRAIISSKISDKEFEAKRRQYSVKFRNKEHLYYYEIYRKEVGQFPKPENGQKACPGCGAGMNLDSFHCKICGYVCERGVI